MGAGTYKTRSFWLGFPWIWKEPKHHKRTGGNSGYKTYVSQAAGNPALYHTLQRLLSTEANESISDVHNRMPLVIYKWQLDGWLGDHGAAEAILRETPPLLERQSVSAQTKLW